MKNVFWGFITWLIESVIFVLLCWGMGALLELIIFGVVSVEGSLIDGMLLGSVMGIIFGLITMGTDTDCAEHLMFFSIGWLLTIPGIMFGIRMYTERGYIPLPFLLIYGGTVVLIFIGSIYVLMKEDI